ncbi:MAG: hypothetical protein ACI854_000320 [Arenicella sp.]|jgi:hypothetical protein
MKSIDCLLLDVMARETKNPVKASLLIFSLIVVVAFFGGVVYQALQDLRSGFDTLPILIALSFSVPSFIAAKLLHNSAKKCIV